MLLNKTTIFLYENKHIHFAKLNLINLLNNKLYILINKLKFTNLQ